MRTVHRFTGDVPQLHGELRLGLLGRLSLWNREGSVALTCKQSQVLALLAASRNATVSLDYLADAIWAGRPPPSSRNVIHGYVRDLRRELALDAREGIEIDTHSSHYSLNVDPTLVDADVFTAMIKRALEMFAVGALEETAERLAASERLWRGPVLLDVRSLVDLAGTVARIEEQRILASELRTDVLIQLGRHREALIVVKPLLHEFPRNENLQMQAMYAMHLAGRRAEALGIYHDFRRALIRELGIEPGPGLKRLQQVILTDDLDVVAPREGGRPILLVDRVSALNNPTAC